jgi:hypothetical protein
MGDIERMRINSSSLGSMSDSSCRLVQIPIVSFWMTS